MEKTNSPKAFISCSLRPEDLQLVSLVEKVVKIFGITPYGTVGRYSLAPIPIPELMKQNISNADCIVVVATPRYLQEDVHTKKKYGKGISEMLHVEIGMAHQNNLPIIAFVFDDTEVGSFLPVATQYIRLNSKDNFFPPNKAKAINILFRNTLKIIRKKQQEKSDNELLQAGGAILKTMGAFALAKAIFGDNNVPRKKKRKTKLKLKH